MSNSTPQANSNPVSLTDIIAANTNIRKILPISPLTHSNVVSELTGHDIYFKWENKFKTGSFKERGAVNFLSCLNEAQKTKGVCAASLGNHALALSYHANKLHIPCTIVMPTQAPLVKVQSTIRTGAKVILFGNGFDEAYTHAQKLAQDEGLAFVSAFDDPYIIAGQGTCGLEILDQVPDVDSIIVPVGGGGLMSGISLAVKAKKPGVYTLGAQSEWVVEGRKGLHYKPGQLLAPVTIADGIAVKGVGKLTDPILKQNVDKFVSLSESEIAAAIIRLLEFERTVVEGAGAAGLAALWKKQIPSNCKKTVIVVSGSNIDMNILSRLIERDMGHHHRLLRIMVSVPDRPGSLHAVTGIYAKLGANVLEVVHDRSFSSIPGNVDISFLLEVKDVAHRDSILDNLKMAGLAVKEI